MAIYSGFSHKKMMIFHGEMLVHQRVMPLKMAMFSLGLAVELNPQILGVPNWEGQQIETAPVENCQVVPTSDIITVKNPLV